MEYNIALGGFVPPSEMLSGYNEVEGFRSVLVAFSGGADSALLLCYLKKWCAETDRELFAAHVNHGIRGEEAIRDREHCRAFCERLSVKLFMLDVDVPTVAKSRGLGIEEAAREVRYEFFDAVMAENNIRVLATAHNADDNLETVIFRLARGTGAAGVCGIPPVRRLGGGFAVRPILSMTKAEILDICDKNGIEYVYDSTNSDTVYTRNSIRAEVLPTLRRINPEVSRAVLRFGSLMREECEYFDERVSEYLCSTDPHRLSSLRVLPKPILMRVLSVLCEEGGAKMPEYVHLNSLLSIINEGREGGSVSLPGGVRAVISGGRLVFMPDTREKKRREAPLAYEIELFEGDNILPGGFLVRLIREASTSPSQSTHQIQINNENIYKLFTQVTLQSDKINGKLFCGSRKSGERIRKGGRGKDLRKLMSEAKVPADERGLYPVIRDGEGALFLPGIAVRDGCEAKKDENTAFRVKLTVMREASHQGE